MFEFESVCHFLKNKILLYRMTLEQPYSQRYDRYYLINKPKVTSDALP